MNPIELVRPHTTKILLGLLAVSLVLNGFLWISLRNSLGREGGLEVALETQKHYTREAANANSRLKEDIATLQVANQALVDQLAEDKRQADLEIALRDEQISDARELAEIERRKRHAVNRSPTCQAFLDGTVADFCPELANGLRERTGAAANHLRDADR